MSFTAIVVDLGAARLQVRDNQSIADFAALAGGAQLPTRPDLACSDAWNYVKANAYELPSTATMDCALRAGTIGPWPEQCNHLVTPSTTVTAQGTGAYTVRFTYPVPDAQLLPPRVLDGIDPLVNNRHQCERMRVDIQRQRPSFFEGVVGGGFERLTASATVRAAFGTTNPTLVALLILDPYACDVLITGGQGKILVYESAITDVPRRPGKIGLDTDASGCAGSNNIWAVDARGQNPQNSQLKAFPLTDGSQIGQIAVFGMRTGQNKCNSTTGTTPANLNVCEQADVDTCVGAASQPDPTIGCRVDPQPTKLPSRATRAQIDNVYNCLSDNEDSPYPGAGGIFLAGCPEADQGKRAYMTELRAAVGRTSPCANSIPCPSGEAAFQNYTTTAFPGYPGGGKCTLQPRDPKLIVPPGNWYVDCPNGLVVKNGDPGKLTGGLEFQGGNIVARNGISVDDGLLRINTLNPNGALSSTCQTRIAGCATRSSANHAYVYLRNGSLTNNAAGSIYLNHTAVYIDEAGNDEFFDFGAQGTLDWTAPAEGPFKNLAVWSESSALHQLGGAATMAITGIIFAPYARFDYDGQACQNAFAAQFVVRTMSNSGQGCLKLFPSYSQVAPIRFTGSNLIR